MITTSYPMYHGDAKGIFVHELAKRLVARGNEVFVIGPKFGVKSKSKEVYEGVIIRRIYIPGKIFSFAELRPGSFKMIVTFLMYFAGALLASLKIIKKVHLIHAHWASPPGTIGVILGKLFKKPVVISVRGSDILDWPGFSRIADRIIKWSVLKANKVLAISQILYQILKIWRAELPQIEVYPRGIDTETFKPQVKNQELIRKYNLENRKIILYVGSLIDRKGPSYLVEAFDTVQKEREDTSLLFVGDGPLENELKKKAKELKIDDKVIFVSKVEPAEVPKYYSICDVFTLPSYSEAMGTVLIEAMACKKPVVVTEKMGMAQSIKDADAGIVVRAKDPSSLADGLLKVLNDTSHAKKMAENGYKYVLKNHTWEAEIAATLRAYESIIRDE